MKSVVGIVLAGGMSRRFGEPKALVSWQGYTFIERIVQVMQDVMQDIVVISHASIKERVAHLIEVPVIEDISFYRGEGPLAGIVSGMEHLEAEWYMISPCDTPNISSKWIKEITGQIDDEYEAIIPIVEGRKQPLLGAYHKNVKEKIYKLLDEEKRSMEQLLSYCNVKYVTGDEWNIEKTWFVNVNTKEEYAKLLKYKKK